MISPVKSFGENEPGGITYFFEAGDPGFRDYFWIFPVTRISAQQITPSLNLQQAEN
jgi:hypothetical protein